MLLPLTALGILLFFLSLISGCGNQQTTDKQAEASVLPVNTARVKTGVLDVSQVVSGKLEAWQSANVVSKAPGKVAAVHVDIGSTVRAGQLMVTLDNTDLAARVEQARAGVTVAESALANAASALAIADSAYQVAEANFQRGKQLLEQGAIPQAVFEAEYELKYKQAKGQVNQAREQVERGIPAQLAQAHANLALAESAYSDSLIKAPISGHVTARNVNPGEMASPTVPVISLVNLDKIQVKISIAESLINQLKEGQKVQVEISAVSGQPFTGIISSLAPAADPVSKGFPVKIQIDNPKHILKPGMFAEVRLSSRQKALLLPLEAVARSKSKSMVWVAKDAQAQKREVQVGDSDSKQIAIFSGIVEGEEVIVSGQESLQEGAKVKIRHQEGK